jgi:hypothetical protein
MAEVGENAADGGRHVRFEVSEDLSQGDALTVLNRAGGAVAGGSASGGTGGVATGKPEREPVGTQRFGWQGPLQRTMLWVRLNRGWFALMLKYCKLTEVDPDKAASVVALYLDGRARVMYLAMLESAKVLNPNFKPTLDWLKDLLYQAYDSVDPIALAWIKLDKLKQGSSSVEEYVTNFEQVCAELGPECPNEPDKIQRFKAGLNSDIRFRCAATPFGRRWTNFQDFVR